MTSINQEMKMSVYRACRNISVNIKITGVRGFSLRMGLALLIIRLGAWVSPLRVEVDTPVFDKEAENV